MSEVKTDVVVATRVVKVISTKGESVSVPFEGTQWSQLKRILESGGVDVNNAKFSSYDLSNMKCVEGVNRTTLEHDQATVPDGDFKLYLMPFKTKSGGVIREAIKNLFATQKEEARVHFGNYTQVKETTLDGLLKSYKGGKYYPTTNNDVVVDTIDVVTVDNVETSTDDKYKEALIKIQDLCKSYLGISDIVEAVVENKSVEVVQAQVTQEDSKEEQLKKQKKEEEDRDKQEMEEMRRGMRL